MVKLELGPEAREAANQGGASSSSVAACHLEQVIGQSKRQLNIVESTPELAMPVCAHSLDCTCVHCLASREVDSEDDIPAPVVYNQLGTIFDPAVPDQIAQQYAPLMRDEFPSPLDPNKWAVRPAGARKNSVPFFYVNANEDHVDDPSERLGCAAGMSGRSLN